MDFTVSDGDSAEVSTVTEIRNWFPIFSKHSIKTKIFDLPERFSSYLVEDGIVLPEGVGKVALGNDMLSDEEEDGGGDKGDMSAADAVPAAFHAFDTYIETTMHDFGGKIMVKANDKAPTDALWINCGTLMCNSLSSVYMMLKASEKVSTSLKESGNYLVIRKWAHMFPSMEFRCFIHGSQIIGTCQKDAATFYPFLHEDSARIQEVILDFFESKIKEKLPITSIVMDVYVDKQDRVWIIGFSPYGDITETDALLFTWDELEAHGCRSSAPFESFRVIKDESSVLPRNSTVGASRGPSDFSLISGDLFSRNSNLLQGNASSSDSDSDKGVA